MEQTLSPTSLEQAISKYSRREFLVQGGMGTTYKAVDQEGQPVLLKELHLRLPPGMSADEAWKGYDLFEREGRILQQLSHPHLPRFIESYSQQENGETKFFLVQQYLPHQNLEQYLRSGKVFTEEEAVLYARQLLGILDYLHTQIPPIVHRDIKPNNILLDEQEKKVYLVDFGSVGFDLAKTVGGSTMLGTPGYAPLEQLVGKAVPASDIYSLGATLFRLLARKEPTDSLTGIRLDVRSHVRASDHLTGIMEKMTEPDVDRRYQNARAVLDDLERKVSLQNRGERTLEMVTNNYLQPRFKRFRYYAPPSILALIGVTGFALFAKNLAMYDFANVMVGLSGFFVGGIGSISALRIFFDYTLPRLGNSRPAKKLQQEYSQFKDQYATLLTKLIEHGQIRISEDIFTAGRVGQGQLPPLFAAGAVARSQAQSKLPPQIKDALRYDYAVHQVHQGNLLEARLASGQITNDKVREELEKRHLSSVPSDVHTMISLGITALPGLQRLYLNPQKHRLVDQEGKPVTASLLAQEVKNQFMDFHSLQDIINSICQQGQELEADAFSFTDPVNAHGNNIFTVSYYKTRGMKKALKEPTGNGM